MGIWLKRWKKDNWQHEGKPFRAAILWQDIAAQLETLVVKVQHEDVHVPKSQATKEHKNNHHITTRIRQLECSREIETENVKVNCSLLGGSVTPPVICKEMQPLDGLMTEAWI